MQSFKTHNGQGQQLHCKRMHLMMIPPNGHRRCDSVHQLTPERGGRKNVIIIHFTELRGPSTRETKRSWMTRVGVRANIQQAKVRLSFFCFADCDNRARMGSHAIMVAPPWTWSLHIICPYGVVGPRQRRDDGLSLIHI